MNLIDLIEKEAMLSEPPAFNVGDTIKVFFKIVEGNKERVQAFEGLVIAKKNGGIRETFTVRKISFGVGVERTFPLHSPRITKVEIIREGKVRRAKLYYIRDLSGKAATRVKEKRTATTETKTEVKTQEEKLATVKANKAKAVAPKKATATKPAAKKAAPAKPKPSEAKRTEARATARQVAKEAEAQAKKEAAEAAKAAPAPSEETEATPAAE